jgi:hypothetical protein
MSRIQCEFAAQLSRGGDQRCPDPKQDPESDPKRIIPNPQPFPTGADPEDDSGEPAGQVQGQNLAQEPDQWGAR